MYFLSSFFKGLRLGGFSSDIFYTWKHVTWRKKISMRQCTSMFPLSVRWTDWQGSTAKRGWSGLKVHTEKLGWTNFPQKRFIFSQCCGSGSVSGLEPDSLGSLDPYLDPDSQSGSSGSRRAKMVQKNMKELIKVIFCSAGCSLLRAEGFLSSFYVLYEGLGIRKLQFLIKKDFF